GGLRPARASLLGGRGRALRDSQPRGRSGGADRAVARRSRPPRPHGRGGPHAVPRIDVVGAQPWRAPRSLRSPVSETDRIRLLIAESGVAFGGTERVVWELATRLPRDRFDVSVWLSPSPGVDELATALAARDVTVERVGEVDSRWDWKGMVRTWRRLRNARPDILHVHHVWPAADRYLTTLAAAAGVKHLVITEHIVGSSHSAAQRALKRRELDRADAVTAVCGAVADSVVADYHVPRSRVRVIRNGTELPDPATIDIEESEARAVRAHLGATAARPLWVCAARLESQKGHDVLLDAAAEMRRRSFAFVLALAGDGSLRGPLEQ